MDRRQALQNVALLLGGTVVGGSIFLQTGCKTDAKRVNEVFDEDQVKYFDEIAETILPRTATPGAKDAAVGAFAAVFVNDCYNDEQQKLFMSGFTEIEKRSKEKFDKGFMAATPAQRTELLTEIDKERREWQMKPDEERNKLDHYFRLMKEVTLLGFFTSEPGATQALRYVAVPGRYDGCVDYKKGDRAWAT